MQLSKKTLSWHFITFSSSPRNDSVTSIILRLSRLYCPSPDNVTGSKKVKSGLLETLEPLRWGIKFEDFPIWLRVMHRGMCAQLVFVEESS